jgi:hypothetical protein
MNRIMFLQKKHNHPTVLKGFVDKNVQKVMNERIILEETKLKEIDLQLNKR